MSESDLSRRVFLGLSVTSMATSLLRCGGSHSSAGAMPPGDAGAGMEAATDAMVGDAVPFGVWSQLQTAVQGSPDHLPAAAARAVATKDPKAIFEFVRDNIVAYPADNVAAVPTQMRWGTRGALRGGAGTPREKVELLAQLYKQAGFQAQVMSAYVLDDSSGKLASQVYLQQVTRTFAPTADEATLSGWLTQMKAGASVPDITPIDPNETQRAAIVKAVTAALPSGLETNMNGNSFALGDSELGQLDEIPFVSVMVNGTATNANVLFPSANFGDPLLPSGGFSPSPADPPDAAPTVTVALSMVTALNPLTQIPLVSATFPADELAGRQLLAQFLPAVSSLAALQTVTVDGILAFRPLLMLAGLDVDPSSDPSFVNLGPTITLHGDVVSTAANGAITVNGQQLYTPSQIVAGASAKVASVSLAVRAGAYPSVSLSVQALDSGGKPVLGLPASAFSVTEEGAAVAFLETGVPTQSMRVMVIIDVDGPLSNGDDPVALAQQLTSAVVAAYPNAAIQLPFSDTVYTDPNAVAAALAASGDDADADWSELGDAASRNPALIVMVADFAVTDFATTDSATFLAEIAAGPPVIAVPTEAAGDPSISPNIATVVSLTKGQLLPNAGITATIAAVLAYLKTYTASGAYTLDYSAPTTGPSTRTVGVKVNGASATGTYTVPTGSAALPAPAIAGLYMTVTLGDNTVTRVLGGYGGDVQLSPGEAIDPSLLDEVRDTLFGVTMLSFEGSAPPFSVQVDDLLSMKLGMKPLYDAVAANDMTAITAALPRLSTFVPSELLTMKAPLSPSTGTGSVTYELGLRIVASSQRPRFTLKLNETRVDIIPVAGWGSLGVDPKASFLDALTRTAGLAVVEAALFKTSTASALAGVALTVIDPSGSVSPGQLPQYDATTQQTAARVLGEYPTCYCVVPAAPPFAGFWAVDGQSGALVGVLPDGTGGGSGSSACMTIAGSDAAFNAVGLLGGLAGVSWAAPFYAVGQITAEIFLITAAIFDGANVMDPIGNVGSAAVCAGLSAGAGLAAGAIGPGANALNNYVNTAGLAGAGPEACPSGGAAIGC